jgi:hypothetical protein
MSLRITKDNIVNYNNEINTNNLSRDQIDEQIKPYLTIKNVGKYIIFRDDSGEAQREDFIVYQIINEAPRSEPPFITTRVMNNGQYQYIPMFGGKVKKSKTKHRKTKHRKTKHRKTKKSKKNASKSKK